MYNERIFKQHEKDLTELRHDMTQAINHMAEAGIAYDEFMIMFNEFVTQSKNREIELRKLLCYQYAGNKAYMDDGCAQDNSRLPFIDFLNDSVEGIKRKMYERVMFK